MKMKRNINIDLVILPSHDMSEPYEIPFSTLVISPLALFIHIAAFLSNRKLDIHFRYSSRIQHSTRSLS